MRGVRRRLSYHILGEHPELLARPHPAKVSERDWDIMLASLRDGRTFADIAAAHGVTPERARQILSRAATAVLADAGVPYDYQRENPAG